MRQLVNIMGYDFQFGDGGVYAAPVNRSINLAAPSYLEATVRAIRIWKCMDSGQAHFVYFVRQYMHDYDYIYKFGYSATPLTRIKVVGADTLLNLWTFTTSQEAHDYESAILYFCRHYRFDFHHQVEWFYLTPDQAARFENSQTAQDLCCVLGIDGLYRRAVDRGRGDDFNPRRAVRKLETYLSIPPDEF